MKHYMYCALSMLIFTTCQDSNANGKDQNESVVPQMEAEASNTNKAQQQDTIKSREALTKEFEYRREQMREEIKKLEQGLDKASKESKKNIQKAIDDLEVQADEIDRRLDELRASTADDFERLRVEMDTTMTKFERAVKSAWEELNK